MSDFATLRRPTRGSKDDAARPNGLLHFFGPDLERPRFFSLRSGLAVLGREDTTDVHVEDHSVSRRHALLEVSPRGATIGDAGSANGVFVNGARVRTHPLNDGDLVRVGDSLLRYVVGYPERTDEGPDEGEMVGGAALDEVRRVLRRAAESHLTLLVLGETGTGKELAARAAHDYGPRRLGPYVPVNCAAMPSELMEAELFGAAKGAYTGAEGARPGLIRAADKGTLFLDEVGDLPPAAQAKLLRFLENHRVRPIGHTEEVEVDVRVVASTNADLEAKVAEGSFRMDLQARLARLVVRLPPLRERFEDIPTLVRRFLEDLGAPDRTVHPDAMERLCLQRWPRNVRGLRAAVERALFAADDATELSLACFDDLAEPPSDAPKPAPTPSNPEAEALVAALKEAEGDVDAAAAALGISRSQLYRRAQRHGISAADFRER